MFWVCVCVAQPRRGDAALPRLAAALGDHVQEHAARRHRDVVRAGRDLDVVEGVEVVVEAGRADGRRVADVDAVQVARVLRAGRAAGVEHALQAARGAAHVGAGDEQAGHLVLDQRPDVAAARRALEQLFAKVHAGVGAGRVDDRRAARDRDRLGHRRQLQLEVEGHGGTDLHRDVLANHRPEALQFDPDRVDPWGQGREAVDAAAVGHASRGARDQHGAGERDGHARHRGALVVGHPDEDRSRLHLGADWTGRQGRQRKRREQHPHSSHELSSGNANRLTQRIESAARIT